MRYSASLHLKEVKFGGPKKCRSGHPHTSRSKEVPNKKDNVFLVMSMSALFIYVFLSQSTPTFIILYWWCNISNVHCCILHCMSNEIWQKFNIKLANFLKILKESTIFIAIFALKVRIIFYRNRRRVR